MWDSHMYIAEHICICMGIDCTFTSKFVREYEASYVACVIKHTKYIITGDQVNGASYIHVAS